MPTENNDLFIDVYAIELMQNDYLELVAESEQATAVKEANRLKSLFLARMSHDLRTPLNSILGFSEFFNLILATIQDKIYIIHRSAEQLNLLINDLLEISSIEAGETKINPGPVDIADLLQEIIRSQQKAAQDKALVLDIEISASLPQWIQTDIKRVRQICANLVNNAIKYKTKDRFNSKQLLCRIY